MNDFDFEELDKAVNALATKTHEEHGGPEPVVEQPKPMIDTPPARSALQSERKTEPEPVAGELAPQPSVTPTTPPPPEPRPTTPPKHRLTDARPRGRGAFMDIVPPAPRKAPTRVGVSVQPVSKIEEIVPEPLQDEPKPPEAAPVMSEHVPAPSSLTDPDVSERHTESSHPEPMPKSGSAQGDDISWPDPLDFGPAAEPEKEPEQKTQEPDKATEPTSPFLAEAKVEKRPLGAFSHFKPVDAQPPAEEPKDPVGSAVVEEPMPEPDHPHKEPQKAPLPPKEGEEKSETEPSKPDLHSAAMMSIPDQYRAEPKSTDKTPRPVYDTKEYHPPLLEAAAHEHRGGSSMWGKLFIALVVLALLAAAGYFVYLYLLQS